MQTYFAWSCILVAVGSVISSLEYLSAASLFSDNGLLAWRVLSVGGSTSRSHTLSLSRFGIHQNERAMRFVSFSKLVLSLLLLCAAHNMQLASALLCGLFVLQLFTTYRSILGGDGSDQMAVIVFVGLASTYILLNNRAVAWVGFIFIAGQSCLSYFVAGMAKARSPVWLSGMALPRVLQTATYGNPPFGRWLERHPLLAKLGCWSVITFECIFPLALCAPQKLCVAILLAGALFHLANAYLMGLNVFLWTFLASYPAIIFTNSKLTGAMASLLR